MRGGGGARDAWRKRSLGGRKGRQHWIGSVDSREKKRKKGVSWKEGRRSPSAPPTTCTDALTLHPAPPGRYRAETRQRARKSTMRIRDYWKMMTKHHDEVAWRRRGRNGKMRDGGGWAFRERREGKEPYEEMVVQTKHGSEKAIRRSRGRRVQDAKRKAGGETSRRGKQDARPQQKRQRPSGADVVPKVAA
ncbi:hypothetical protein C8R44DRAFT_750302 [Mycena epipterygia]|nr:hypothetical protein C8R44DRAFT_750302 [Mycena epipterygia]